MIYRFILVGILVLFSIDALAGRCAYCGIEGDWHCSVCRGGPECHNNPGTVGSCAYNEKNEKEEFKKLVDQEAYKIQPLPLATINVILKKCMRLPREGVYATITKFADVIPVPLYWLDENNHILGANKVDLEAVGSIEVAVGKTAYDILPYDMADVMVRHNNLVMQTGKILSQEEQVKDFTTGKIKRFAEFKAPLYDNTGKVIGILGAAVELQ